MTSGPKFKDISSFVEMYSHNLIIWIFLFTALFYSEGKELI